MSKNQRKAFLLAFMIFIITMMGATYQTKNLTTIAPESTKFATHSIPTLSIKSDIVFVGTECANAYYSPSTDGTIAYIYYQGQEVERLMTFDNGWCLIYEDGQNLFVKTNTLIQKEYLGDFKITYYCPCNICNGPWGPYDKFGNPLTEGTAAVDPSVIPMNTEFIINDTKMCIAKDVGGAIKGNRIDVFVDVPHHICETMGNDYEPVYTYKKCE